MLGIGFLALGDPGKPKAQYQKSNTSSIENPFDVKIRDNFCSIISNYVSEAVFTCFIEARYSYILQSKL